MAVKAVMAAKVTFWTPTAGVWQNAVMDSHLRWAGLHKAWSFGLLPGFLYWVAFLLVLEPDNVARAIHAGYAL